MNYKVIIYDNKGFELRLINVSGNPKYIDSYAISETAKTKNGYTFEIKLLN